MSANSYIHIRQLDDINVQACACDSLYRTVTKVSFCRFRAMAVKLSFVYLINNISEISRTYSHRQNMIIMHK